MVKKFSVLALAGLLALPAAASADVSPEQLEKRVEALTRELNELKAQMEEMKEENEEMVEEFEESSEKWDLASRFEWSGDFRARLDSHRAETAESFLATDVARGITTFTSAQPGVSMIAGGFATIGDMLTALQPALADFATWQGSLDFMFGGEANNPFTADQEQALFAMFTNQGVGQLLTGMAAESPTAITNAMATPEALAGFMRNLSAADRKAIFNNMGFNTVPSRDYEDDTLWSNRLRLNLRAKATENVEFKGRIVGYKAWGIQHNPMDEDETGVDSPYFLNSRTFDGTVGRKPVDSNLVLDRAFINWNNIGGQPVWFSIGRRPTTDGPPENLRLGVDERLATPTAYMNYPFDGISLGYAYRNLFGMEDAPGRIRFCYGRGFEAGPQQEDTGINDVDFAGLSWDVYNKGYRFLTVQSFGAFNLFNVPGDTFFPNPIELAGGTGNGLLDRTNLGNVYHTSGVYMDKIQNLNYFVTLGWSHTDPKGMDELGNSLLSDFWEPLDEKDGYAIYLGVRYDLDDYNLKFGAEYNYGSKNWLGFTPGHDDMYSSKLWTRGSAYEVYTIWDIPSGEAISKYADAFIRLGYQYIDFDYTYSGMWLGTPTDLDEIKNDPLEAQFYPQFDNINQVYLTLEAWF